ncbi:hypothetical protein RchiOBHm_Chr4g0410041 [Rosa chinensis]|uniref:Uncharacterized protein n=1 Tax=Rosa chinensis TaxID=74649 RepID=A0A2P6QVA4_ROSCH|nr:hypothetical protein RchiOBHm_Chr4g0410041 [Rosa chinensis]
MGCGQPSIFLNESQRPRSISLKTKTRVEVQSLLRRTVDSPLRCNQGRWFSISSPPKIQVFSSPNTRNSSPE